MAEPGLQPRAVWLKACQLTIPTENSNPKILVFSAPRLEERSLEVKVEALQKRTMVITTLTQVWVAYDLEEFTHEVQLVNTN